LSVIKNLIFLGARFFLIASIVTAIVVAIFTNWNTLKEKLKPVFDFMAKIGQAVPQAIAKAWNFAVDVIFGAIKGILSSGKAVADFLKNTFNVDIGTANIDKYMASIDQARNNLQTNADEVKSIFEGIADETGNAFTFIKDQVLGTGASTDKLGDDVL
jgi:Flp pilus assembly pilin Flp